MDGVPSIQGSAVTQAGSRAQSGIVEREASHAFGQVAEAARSIGEVLRGRNVKKGKEDALKDFNERDEFARDIGADGLGDMAKDETGFLGMRDAGAVAYNNMLETMYIQRSQADFEAKSSELATEHYGDVAAYDKAMNAYREGLTDSVDLNFSDEVFYSFNRVHDNGRANVAKARQQADISEARTAMDARLTVLQDDLDAVLRDGGVAAMQSPEAQDMIKDLNDQLDIKAENPLYAYSEDERALDADAIAVRLETAALLPEIEDAYARGGYSEALQRADQLSESMGRATPERATLRSNLRQEAALIQQNKNAELSDIKAEADAAEAAMEARGAALDRSATDVLYNPSASADEKLQAVRAARNYVTPARYTTLMNKVFDTDDTGVDNTTFTALQVEAMRGELTYDDVVDLESLTNSQRTMLLNDVEKSQNGLRKLGTSMFAAAFNSSSFMSDNAEKQELAMMETQATRELDEYIASRPDEQPATRAEIRAEANKIIASYDRGSALAAQSQYLGTNMTGVVSASSIDPALKKIREDLDANRITPEQAAEEMLLIKDIERTIDGE